MRRSTSKKSFFILWCLTCMVFFSYGQRLKESLNKGDRYYQKKDYENALPHYLDAFNLDPQDANTNFKLGAVYFHSGKMTAALPYLDRAYKFTPEIDPNIDYYLAMAYQHDHQYTRAAKHYAAFKSRNSKLSNIADRKVMECVIGDSLLRHPANVTIQSLGTVINTAFAEFAPCVSADGKTLIFTSNRSLDEYEIKSGTNRDHVYITENDGSEWGTPRLISAEINVKYKDAAAFLSRDGRTLLLLYAEGEGDIYTSNYVEGNWTRPVALNKFINNPHYQETSACLSPDGKTLYFSSNRPGGKGGFDIYGSELGPNGQWGRAFNLGSTINTRGDEETPFLHSDAVTLYFSSNGHATLGSNDIFKTELRDGKWTQPENLGYPINSSAYNGYFILSDDGKTGYYSLLHEGESDNTDLYVIHFLDSEQESASAMVASARASTDDFVDPVIEVHKEKEGVTQLKGVVRDVATSQPLVATIRLVDNAHHRILSKLTTGPSGVFELLIPHGGNYGVTTEKKGYLFNSVNFSLPAFEKYHEVEKQILMAKAEVGSKVILRNIFFDVSESELRPESLGELENLRDLLRQNHHLRVQINGHTDNTGREEMNLALSVKRAQAVVQYLISQGIEPARLLAKGYGSEKPLVSNDDETDGRQINRRTEIEIIGSTR